jgi:tetratricopeptide (TPR) repeat protein
MGYIGTKRHLVTICYAGGECENSTLTNHIEMIDNNNAIHLMRFHPSPSSSTSGREQLQETNNVTTLYQYGQDQAGSKNYTGAEALYQKALAIDPKNVDVLTDMGPVLYDTQNYTGAIRSLDKALTIDPSSVYALEQKGYILSELGHYKEALVYFNKALELNPDDYVTLNNKGVTLISLGDYRHAIMVFDAALKVNTNVRGEKYSYPDASVSYFSKAFALLHLGQSNHRISDIHLALQAVGKGS